MLINIVGESDSKANEEQNSMTEEDLKNNIILDIVSSIAIFQQHPIIHGYQENQPSA